MGSLFGGGKSVSAPAPAPTQSAAPPSVSAAPDIETSPTTDLRTSTDVDRRRRAATSATPSLLDESETGGSILGG